MKSQKKFTQYKKSIEKEMAEITAKIKTKEEEVYSISPISPDFGKKYSELNHLRMALRIKQDRLANVGKDTGGIAAVHINSNLLK